MCSFYGVNCSAGAVTALNLRSNQLVGPVPSSIGNLGSLTFFSLGKNNVTGSIPESVYGLTQLSLLDFSQNPLSGALRVLSCRHSARLSHALTAFQEPSPTRLVH